MRSPAALIVAAVAALLVLQPQSASAAWAATGSGTTGATAGSVHRAAAPTATQLSSSVRLDWPAVTLTEGTAATGYTVLRHSGATTTQVCSTVAPTRTCTDPAPVQGAVQYGVVARFQSWTGQESPLTSFTFDVVPPTTTLSSNPAPDASGWNSGPVTLTLTATDTASAVASITYRIGAGSPVTVSGSSTSFPVSAQGQTTVTYFATDVFGNVETTRSYTVKINTAPTTPTINNTITNDTGTAGDRVTNAPAQTLSGTADAGSTVTVSRGATTFGPVVAAANGTWSVPVTLADGVNSFTAVAVNAAGNASATSTALTANLDRVAPTVTITDPQNGVAYVNGGQGSAPRWSNTCAGSPGACGTASDSGSGVVSVTLELKDKGLNTCWTGSATNYATCGSGLALAGTTTWAQSIGFGVVRGRSLELKVTVTDLAGNVGTATVGFSVS